MLMSLYAAEMRSPWMYSCLCDTRHPQTDSAIALATNARLQDRSQPTIVLLQTPHNRHHIWRGHFAPTGEEVFGGDGVIVRNTWEVAIIKYHQEELTLAFCGPSYAGLTCGLEEKTIKDFVMEWPDHPCETTVAISPSGCCLHSKGSATTRSEELSSWLESIGYKVSCSNACPICESGEGKMPRARSLLWKT